MKGYPFRPGQFDCQFIWDFEAGMSMLYDGVNMEKTWAWANDRMQETWSVNTGKMAAKKDECERTVLSKIETSFWTCGYAEDIETSYSGHSCHSITPALALYLATINPAQADIK